MSVKTEEELSKYFSIERTGKDVPGGLKLTPHNGVRVKNLGSSVNIWNPQSIEIFLSGQDLTAVIALGIEMENEHCGLIFEVCRYSTRSELCIRDLCSSSSGESIIGFTVVEVHPDFFRVKIGNHIFVTGKPKKREEFLVPSTTLCLYLAGFFKEKDVYSAALDNIQ